MPVTPVEMEHSADDMEAASLAFGIFTTFNAVVEDVLLFQAARDFTISYTTSATQLSNAQLRFARWGKALGLTMEDFTDAAVASLVPESDRTLAKRNLDHLQTLIREAKKKSRSYEHHPQNSAIGDNARRSRHGIFGRARRDDRTLTDEHSSSSEDDIDILNKQVHKMSIDRTKKTPFIDRARWALFDKTLFEELLRQIISIMDDLERLFPSSADARKVLADEELRELGEQKVQEILQLLADKNDKMLKKALEEKKEAEKVATSETTRFGDYNYGWQSKGDVNGGTINIGRSS